jgi:RimJ/RimL family protein N-acetyltransferase
MSRVIIFAADVNETIARTEPRPGIRWGEPGDLPALSGIGLRETWLKDRLDRGARLVVAEEDGRIVGYVIYVTVSPVRQYSWLLVHLRPKSDTLSMGGFVVPAKRGRQLIGDMKGYAARHFHAEGYRRNISVVRSGNRASVRAHAAIGATPLISLWHARIGKLRLIAPGNLLARVMWGKQTFVVTV